MLETTPKPGCQHDPGMSVAATYLLAMRCPVYRGRDPDLGFRAELENLDGDAKGKDAMGPATRVWHHSLLSDN